MRKLIEEKMKEPNESMSKSDESISDTSEQNKEKIHNESRITRNNNATGQTNNGRDRNLKSNKLLSRSKKKKLERSEIPLENTCRHRI